MKLIINIGQHLLVGDEYQAQALELLRNCRIVREEGYYSDQTYHPCDEVPTIKYVKEDSILGYKDAFKEKSTALDKANSERSSAQYKAYDAEKKLKEALEELERVKASITNVIAVDVTFKDDDFVEVPETE